jgi:aryl-alcohol dehydrogenase-like predicted oxidoreductase
MGREGGCGPEAGRFGADYTGRGERPSPNSHRSRLISGRGRVAPDAHVRHNLLNRQPEVEILPACDHYGIGVASYSPIARGALTGKYAPGGGIPEDSRAARKDRRMMETEFRQESFVIAQTLKAHSEKTGRSAMKFALAWTWANQIVTSVIAGPRTIEHWQDCVGAIGTKWSTEDEALVDSLVKPGHPSTPGYNDPQYPFNGRVVAD